MKLPVYPVAVAALIAVTSQASAEVAAPAVRPLPIQIPKRDPSREQWQIDQLQLPADTPVSLLKALEPDHSMEAVIKRLKAMGVPFRRVRLSVLPDRLSPQMRELVLKMPPGEPFVNPEAGYISVNVLIGRRLPNDVVRLTPPPLPFARHAEGLTR